MKYHYSCETHFAVWDGTILPINESKTYEFIVQANGRKYHMIVGTHAYGNYVCIPDWNIGADLSFLTDSFWNREHLQHQYPELSEMDIISISNALATIGDYINQ